MSKIACKIERAIENRSSAAAVVYSTFSLLGFPQCFFYTIYTTNFIYRKYLLSFLKHVAKVTDSSWWEVTEYK